MTVERVFLDWSRPLAESVAEWLWQKETGTPRDFSHFWVMVPTRQSGRNLRQALARRAARESTGLIGLQVGLPRDLVQPTGKCPVAPPMLEQALWADLLYRARETDYPSLHLPPSPRPWLWALQTARTLQTLRLELTEAEHSFADVAQLMQKQGWESDRWQALARLEEHYRERLAEAGFSDRCREEGQAALHPQINPEIRQIVVAGVPDLAPLFAHALESLSARCTVTILVHAPPSAADDFDPWGRPIPDRWAQMEWPIPDWQETLIPVEEPADLGPALLQTLADCSHHFALPDMAIGITDPLLAGFLIEPLERQGFVVFDPSRQPLARHPVITLLADLQSLAWKGDYVSFSRFLRHADVLHCLSRAPWSLDAAQLLTELDTFQNLYLPHSLEEFTPDRLEGRLAACGQSVPAFPALQTALALATSVATRLRKDPSADTLRGLLSELYGDRILSDPSPGDRLFRQIVSQLAVQLTEWETTRSVIPTLSLDQAHQLFSTALASQVYSPPPPEADFAIEGWLELHWNEAPVLALAGLNEGYVPRVRYGDAWLPNSLRETLGLPGDRFLAARDLYLLRAMIESRRCRGRVALYCLRKGPDGEPLKPSRLLFRGPDSDLLPLAEHLLSRKPKTQTRPPPHSHIRLSIPADFPTQWPPHKPLPVTAFRDYLDDPFLFYLKHVLELKELSDTRREPDPLDFGSLIHVAAQTLSEVSPKTLPTELSLRKRLEAAAENWMSCRFGRRRDASLQAILVSAQNRLRSLAHWQWQTWQEGWRIVATEHPLSTMLGGLTVRGRADYIAWHPDSRTVRILDLKTGGNIKPCSRCHLGPLRPETPHFAQAPVFQNRPRRWLDLQLPLYIKMWQQENPLPAERIVAGYLRLPSQPLDSPLDLWTDLDETLLESAWECARHVADAIRAGRFGPTSSRPQYPEPFRTRFGGEPADLFDPRTPSPS